MIAQQARLGNITEASLTDSITRFKKSVKDFKEKNKINYDLAPRRKNATVDKSKLNENGEVKDEFFAEAVRRMYQDEARRTRRTHQVHTKLRNIYK